MQAGMPSLYAISKYLFLWLLLIVSQFIFSSTLLAAHNPSVIQNSSTVVSSITPEGETKVEKSLNVNLESSPERSAIVSSKYTNKELANSINGVQEVPEHGLKTGNLVLMSLLLIVTVMIVIYLLIKISHKENIERYFVRKRFRAGLLLGLSITFLVMSVIVYVVLDYNHMKIKEGRKTELQVLLKSTHERLQYWINDQKYILQQVANNRELIEVTENLLKINAEQGTLVISEEQKKAREFFSKIKNRFGEKGFFIIRPDYISVGSMRDENLGIRNLIVDAYPELLEAAFSGRVVFIPPIHSDVKVSAFDPGVGAEVDYAATMFFAAPVRNNSGEIIAVLTKRVDPLAGLSVLFGTSRIGQSGETYAFNKNGYLLTESRFRKRLSAIKLLEEGDYSSLKVRLVDPGVNLLERKSLDIKLDNNLPLTRMALSATNGNDGYDMEGYRDYRGVPVVGVWLWDESLKLGIASEIDVDEAFETYFLTRRSILGLLLFTFVLSSSAILFTLYSGERASQRLARFNRELHDEIEERKQAEHQLKDREELLGSILATVADGVITIDEAGNVAAMNPAAEKMFGYTQNELFGTNVKQLMPSEFSEHHDEYINNYLTTGEKKVIGRGIEVSGKRRDGSLFPLKLSINEMKIAGRRMFVGVVEDITERKKAEQKISEYSNHLEKLVEQRTADLQIEEERSRALLESAGEGIYGLDTNGNTTFVNPAAAEMLGYTVDELVGIPMHKTVHHSFANGTSYPTEQCPMYKASKTGKSYHVVDEVLWRKDGSSFPVEYTSRPVIKNGQILGAVIVFTDISQRKQAEQELKQAKEDAETANKAKSSFLANMSHELRTPLNAILGFSEILEHDPLLNNAQKDNIAIINRSGKHLLSMIKDVLDLSKIEAGRVEVEYESFDVSRMFDELALMFKARADRSGIGFNLFTEPMDGKFLKSDPGKIRQILINLLSNAIKFTQHGFVNLRAEMHDMDTEQKHGVLSIHVEDSGPGISDEDQEKIFEPFVQAEAGSTSNHGTGLGLAISKSFIELMGGSISVKSELGQGARFQIELPVELVDKISPAYSEEKLQTIPVLKPGQPAWRILIVEDNLTNRKLLSSLLKKAGFEIMEAVNGAEGVKEFQEWKPDFIWMDIQMPVMDGYEATRQIRRLPGGDKVKIVAITANAMRDQQQVILDAGCDDIILKPYQLEEVFSTLAKYLDICYMDNNNERKEQQTLVLEPEMLSTLSIEELRMLYDAIVELDINYANSLLENYSSLDQQHIDVIRRYISEFDFKTLKRVMKEALSKRN